MYIVEGVVMGTAILVFNATVTTGKVITSWPAGIQVSRGPSSVCYYMSNGVCVCLFRCLRLCN